MPQKPTIFLVTDIETTLKRRIAFDIAWKAIDKQNNEYGKGSYIITEAFKQDVPYFKEKLGYYFEDTYSQYIEPLPLFEIRRRYNELITELHNIKHKVIFCAYNARFDAKYLGETCQNILQRSFLDTSIPLLDIWDFWCNSAPRNYNYKTDKGNPKTSAEFVYRFENQKPSFIERHIAFSDVEIECEILLKVLRRKKKMPIVSHYSQLTNKPWTKLLSHPAYYKKW